MNGDVTAMDINCALASRYRRDGDGYWSEISVTEPNDTVLRLDGVALEVNWRGDTWISGFEVKVSRGDFPRREIPVLQELRGRSQLGPPLPA